MNKKIAKLIFRELNLNYDVTMLTAKCQDQQCEGLNIKIQCLEYTLESCNLRITMS